MAVKYTTATKVRAMLGEYVNNLTSDTEIEVWIEEAEGFIDTWLKIGSGTGANTFTFSASKKPHLVLELAATSLAASIALSHSTVSWLTMESAVFMMETCVFWWEQSKALITSEEFADFILEQ